MQGFDNESRLLWHRDPQAEGKSSSAFQNFDGLQVWSGKTTAPQDAQKGRSAISET